MPGEATKPAILNDQELSRLRAFEAKLGGDVVLVAYDKPLEPAELSAEQLEQLKSLEKEMGHVFLVARKRPTMVCG